MTVAFLFPGQGMEVPRMGVDLARRHLPAMDLLLQTGEALGVNLLRLLERGGAELLRTEVLQPALCAVSLGALDWLRQAGVTPAWVAGHSLGEVAAWSATGAVCARDAVALAATRGRLMAREAERFPGDMLALVDSGPDDLARALHLGRGHGELYLAAHNAPDEWVLTGEIEALLTVGTFMPSRPLHSAGAWHCPAMSGGVDELRREMETLPGAEATIPMLCNATGEPAPPERIPELLAGQLIAPVQWARTMETLGREGVTDLVTVGPGKVLRGLARKNLTWQSQNQTGTAVLRSDKPLRKAGRQERQEECPGMRRNHRCPKRMWRRKRSAFPEIQAAAFPGIYYSEMTRLTSILGLAKLRMRPCLWPTARR